MNKRVELIKHFAPYCSQCNGLCCKRGVFSLFEWEMKRLLCDCKDFQVDIVSDQRGTCIDIAMNDLCIFNENNGCLLPEKLRPIDCLSYPFYPKLKENKGALEIDYFVIDIDCPYHIEIAENELILNEVRIIWKSLGKKVTLDEVNDWLGKDGRWKEWYQNSVKAKYN
jgi:hypothetical protein